MSGFMIWLLLVVIPGISVVFGFSLGVLFFSTFIWFMFYAIDNVEEAKKQAIKYKYYYISVVMSLVFFAALIPNRDDMVIIVSGHYATNIKGVSELSPNLVKHLNKYLKEDE